MAREYEIDITMDAQTVQALKMANFRLYGMKAVQSQQGGGAPLVWFETQEFATTTAIQWEAEYQVYTSGDKIIPHGQITASQSRNINPGNAVDVGTGGVIGTPYPSPPKTAISLNKKSTDTDAGGISVFRADGASPVCAFPLYHNEMMVIVPVEKVLLMFTTTPFNAGTVVENAVGAGIFIDMTTQNHRSVNFDINNGWSWGGASWATPVAPNENLIPILIA